MNNPSRKEMYNYYFEDPKNKKIVKTLNKARLEYFYFNKGFDIKTGDYEVCNICILGGNSKLIRNQEEHRIGKFDMAFLPENEEIKLIPNQQEPFTNKICVVSSPIVGKIGKEMGEGFTIKHFSWEKFVPRGELGDNKKMATYREVLTYYKNGYFMSGFTNIPKKSLEQGVVTSVNLEESKSGKIRIYPHIHSEFPEVYIFCISDKTKSVAVTQYLINSEGNSVCKDLIDGEGLFFEGFMGHMNFIKPTYKNLEYCMYMWIIPTFGKEKDITPTTLLV